MSFFPSLSKYSDFIKTTHQNAVQKATDKLALTSKNPDVTNLADFASANPEGSTWDDRPNANLTENVNAVGMNLPTPKATTGVNTRPQPDPMAANPDQTVANRLLSGRSSAEEALIAALDPARNSLMSDFANMGATGAGALNSMMLKQASDVGGKVADIRQQDQSQGFDDLMALLENPNITPEEAGVITSQALSYAGIDASKIPRLTDRERFETKYLKEKGFTKSGEKYLDGSGRDVTESVGKVINNYVNSSMGLDFEGNPINSANDPNDRATWDKDPMGEDTIKAAKGGNRQALVSLSEAAKATGDYSYLKDVPKSSPLYAEATKGISNFANGSNKTTNKWDDVWYFSNYATEDADGDTIYEVGKRFVRDGVIYEITGQTTDYKGAKGDGAVNMMAKNLVTGDSVTFKP